MKRVYVLFTLLAGLCACVASKPALPAVDLTLAPRERETDYLRRALKALHPDPFANCGREAFSNAVTASTARLREGDARSWHLEIRKLVALVGDSHTRVEGLGPFEASSTPCLLRHFSDGWWIVGAYPGFETLVGQRVHSLGGRSMAEVVAAVRPYASFENEAALLNAVPGFVRRPEFLHAIGVTANAQQVELELEDLRGVRRAETVSAVSAVPEDRAYHVFLVEPDDSAPWRLRQGERAYWHEFIAANALYIRYRRCVEDAAVPMRDFANAIAASLRTRKPRLAIVDLRDNGGGNSAVLAPVIAELARKDVRARTEVWAITNAGTFSSGLLNAWQLRRDAGARLAGEPSAQRPNSFGELRGFTLPVSGIKVSCSTKTFRIVPGDPEVLEVNLRIDQRGEDWFRGRDPVLTRLLAE